MVFIVVSVVMVPCGPDVDGETATSLVSVGVSGLVQDMMSPSGEVVTGQVRCHDMLNLDIVLKIERKTRHVYKTLLS